jgi:hypothetical protein
MAGVLLCGLIVVIGALTGVWSAPIHAAPVQHALFLVVAGYPCIGAVPGLMVGLLLNWWTRRRREK